MGYQNLLIQWLNVCHEFNFVYLNCQRKNEIINEYFSLQSIIYLFLCFEGDSKFIVPQDFNYFTRRSRLLF